MVFHGRSEIARHPRLTTKGAGAESYRLARTKAKQQEPRRQS
ncbi:hypothetical protein ACFY0F_13975 [Streptomyces sp. NPDC001544]